MTLTPIFHFVCRYCGTAFDLIGERIVSNGVNLGWLMKDQECATLETANCLSDTCKGCMPIYHKQAAQERDFQAEQDMK